MSIRKGSLLPVPILLLYHKEIIEYLNNIYIGDMDMPIDFDGGVDIYDFGDGCDYGSDCGLGD